MTLGIKTCFSLVLRVDRFLLLNRIRSFRNTRSSHHADLRRFYGSLLLVVVGLLQSVFLHPYLSRLPYHVHDHIDTVARWFAP